MLYEISGDAKLNGEIKIPGSSNAAILMMCATLLTDENVKNLIEILRMIGAEIAIDEENKIVEITAKNIAPENLKNCVAVRKLKTAILLSGPLLARWGEINLPRAPHDPLLHGNKIFAPALETLGVEISRNNEKIFSAKISREQKNKNHRLLFSEASVVGTANTALFCAGRDEEVEIFHTSTNPIVGKILKMLQKMGAEIEGLGTPFLKIRGREKLSGGEFEIPSDATYAGLFAIFGVGAAEKLILKNVDHFSLFPLYTALKNIGANFEIEKKLLKIKKAKNLHAISKIQTAVFPGFSTDLQSAMGVLLTQCDGASSVFETLFENRLVYLWELEKMGAKIEIASPRRGKIFGPTRLRGAEVSGWGFVATPAMIFAGLLAEGKTRVSTSGFLRRNFENFVENLQILGAGISEV